MSAPIVIGYHLYWTVYGAWLPNDVRGSMSRQVRNPWVAELGASHYGRKPAQPASRTVRTFLAEARDALKHPVFEFRRDQFPLVADSLGEVIEQERYTCYALVVMPDHVHTLIRKHKHRSEQMIGNLQDHTRLRLSESLNLPVGHPVWTIGGHAIYLDHPNEIRRTIAYIENNPSKIRLPRQQWSFVKPYDGWPLHPGHDPNSPYARRLRRS